MKTYDAIIIGGGIAGLTAAWKLLPQTKNLLLLEAEAACGGNVKTFHSNGFTCEMGPHSFMGSAEYIWLLLEELGLQDRVQAAAATSKNRYIYRHHALAALPGSLGSFISSHALSLSGKLRLMIEPFIPNGAKEDESAWDFFCRRFGREAATYIMTPFVSGIYAGDIHQLGAATAFKKFWQFERNGGSMIVGAFQYMKKKRKRLAMEGKQQHRGLFSLKDGLGSLTSLLAERLFPTIRCSCPVQSIHSNNGHFAIHTSSEQFQTKSVIMACPPSAAAAILQSFCPKTAHALQHIPMAAVTVLHWTAPEKNNKFPDGFGFLMPKDTGLRILGTLFPGKIFSGRAPLHQALFASFYGGMNDKPANDLSAEETRELLIREHEIIFKQSLTAAKVIKILRYPQAIPQLLPGHTKTIRQLELLSALYPGLYFAGNYLLGVSIENAVESGFKSSAACIGFLRESAHAC
jgi:oxygen-dependent protoporphyrinogen oxidase